MFHLAPPNFRFLLLAMAAGAGAPCVLLSQDSRLPESMFAAAEDLEVSLWASAPDVRNPTNMDIDHAGRIWVAQGVNYRHNQARDPGGDRIVVLEDSDGDGEADRSWTFVQEPELVAPMGVAVIDNKIYVSNAPDLIVYTDVDRDLVFDPRVDKREVLLTGFNGINHDHSLHSVTFGPDGMLYLNHGNSGALLTDRSGRSFRIGSAYRGVFGREAEPLYGIDPIEYAGATSDDGHVYVGGFAMRIRPDGTQLEVIGHNFRNSYEQAVNSFGEVFQNDNDDPPASRTSYLLEYGNAGWFSSDGSRFWQADRRPGQDVPTAQWRQDDPGVMPSGDVYGAGAPTGIAYYENGALGEQWQGLLLSCEAARNVVFGYRPEPDGAGYLLERFDFLTSNEGQELAGIDGVRGKTSSDLKTFFRPSDVAVGPDGAIYVADWFDPRVGGHSDQDETTSGAIYRIAPKGFVPKVPELDLRTVAGQLEALKSPAVNVRALGFQALTAAGDRALGPVSSLLEDDNAYIRGRAVWLLAQLGEQGKERVESLLGDDDPRLRATALQALRRVVDDIAPYARMLADDASAQVRREVAVSLRDVPFEKSGEILLSLALGYESGDRMLLEAWGIGCSGKEEEVFALVEAAMGADAPEDWSPAYRELAWRLTPTRLAPAFAALAQPREGRSDAQRLEALTALAFTASQETVDALFDLSRRTGIVSDTARWWLLNHREIRYADFGVSERLKEEGIYDPSKIVVSGSIIQRPEEEKRLSVDAILALKGDEQAGATKVASCYVCHKVGDAGIDYGPDLTGWASRQSTAVTVRSIVDPSFDIAHGYEGSEVALKNGTEVHGIIQAYGDPLQVRSMGGFSQLVPQSLVQRVRSRDASLMLSADQLGLSEQDVADIVAYLKTL